uniref:Putative transcription factor bHLH69-like n=1 Tax=Solanum chacoense TaxID=4108 RepID=A0A0V0HWX4_SOLCH
MKFPKLEPVTDNLQLYPYNNEVVLSEPFNYFSNGFGYHSLPDLRCLEQPNYLDFSSSLVTTENRVVEPVRPVSEVMSNLLKNRQPYSSSTTRLRRQKLSEKIRCLEKLLPWDKKMDTATMLEEAYKYVKFLQAQISVLQSMPPLVEGGASSDQDRNGKSTSYGSNHEAKAISVFGTLARLNRQQLLQVLLNSPVAQTYLYSKGCCVYSVEQLVQYRKIAQRNAFYRRSLFFSGMLS